MRLYFASPTEAALRGGTEILADICRTGFGVPERSGNIAQLPKQG
jgi:hypothetical protein